MLIVNDDREKRNKETTSEILIMMHCENCFVSCHFKFEYLLALSTMSNNKQRTMGKRGGFFGKRSKPWVTRGRETLDTVGSAALSALPTCASGWVKAFFGATLVLYILNQKHMLPRPISAVVSKALFWPTLPITVGRRLGQWTTVVDETVVIGGAPFGFANVPEKLYNKYGVRICE